MKGGSREETGRRPGSIPGAMGGRARDSVEAAKHKHVIWGDPCCKLAIWDELLVRRRIHGGCKLAMWGELPVRRRLSDAASS